MNALRICSCRGSLRSTFGSTSHTSASFAGPPLQNALCSAALRFTPMPTPLNATTAATAIAIRRRCTVGFFPSASISSAIEG